MSGSRLAKLGIGEFVELLGAPEAQVQSACGKAIAAADFRHIVLEGAARDEVVLKIVKTLTSDLPVSGRDRLGEWETGWAENLSAFEASGGDPRALVPMYYRRGRQVMRLSGQYVLPESESFELNFLEVLRAWIGAAFFRDVEHVYEFGCGSCHNLVALAALYPDKTFHALDWAVASQEIAALVSVRLGIRLDGRRFDMFSPDYECRIEGGGGVLTFGALEQLGCEFDAFLDYVLKQTPAVCVHVEPICELYDDSVLFDYLAARYSEKRGYLRRYLTRLRQLEQLGAIRIRHVKKNLGSLFHDGWTTVVWTPA